MKGEAWAFTRACMEHGCSMPRCRPAARDLLVEMQTQAMSNKRDEHGNLKGPNRSMGVLIKQGLAKFEPAGRLYSITEKGRVWLEALRTHGLLGALKPAEAGTTIQRDRIPDGLKPELRTHDGRVKA